MMLDFIKAMGEYSGKNFSVKLSSWPEVLAALYSGEVDVVSGILKTPERSRMLDFTTPYLIETYAIFTRKDTGIRDTFDLVGKTSVILQSDAVIEEFMSPGGFDSSMYLVRSP